MAEGHVTRRLAAILAADVAGYSRLMGDDERATISTLREYREVFREHIESNGGRVVDMAGDSVLAVFDSASGAVLAATQIQDEIAQRNDSLPDERRMLFRIGVNLGDIEEAEDGTVYGDGVNVAARLEGLAKPGGVMISEFAYQQVRRNSDFTFADAGSHEVKNIAEPVHAYHVGVGSESVGEFTTHKSRHLKRIAVISAALVLAAVAGTTWLLSGNDTPGQSVADDTPKSLNADSKEKGRAPSRVPSIAVLPFVNMSNDQEQEHFVDGMTETLITDLSKLRDIVVIARTSVFTYKGKPVDVRVVGKELGVRHILEGSVQKHAERLRVNVQLVDALTGDHVWAERFDRPYADLFEIQDEITRAIVAELDVQLVEGEHTRLWRRATRNPLAYEMFLKGKAAHQRYTKEQNHKAMELLTKALELDPDFTTAMVFLGWSEWMDASSGWTDNVEQSYENMRQWGEKAIAVDEDSGDAYALLHGYYAWYKFDQSKGLDYGRKSIALSPNNSVSLMLFTATLVLNGKSREALDLANRALRLNPYPPSWFDVQLVTVHYAERNYDEAIMYGNQCRQTTHVFCYFWLIPALVEAGRIAEAQTTLDEFTRKAPNFDFDFQLNPDFLRKLDPDISARRLSAYCKAGIEKLVSFDFPCPPGPHEKG